MSRRQQFWRITVPLALPIIRGRDPRGHRDDDRHRLARVPRRRRLGDLVFANLQNANYDAVLGGGIVIGLLAVLADFLLLGLQTALNRGRGPISAA